MCRISNVHKIRAIIQHSTSIDVVRKALNVFFRFLLEFDKTLFLKHLGKIHLPLLKFLLSLISETTSKFQRRNQLFLSLSPKAESKSQIAWCFLNVPTTVSKSHPEIDLLDNFATCLSNPILISETDADVDFESEVTISAAKLISKALLHLFYF